MDAIVAPTTTANSFPVENSFKIGDHINVSGGRLIGESGLIVHIGTRAVTIVSDAQMEHLKVLPRYITVNKDRTSNSVNILAGFQHGDFVRLDNTVVGVVEKLVGEYVYVLNMYGKVIKCDPTSLQKKNAHAHAMALDAEQNQIHRFDRVTILKGKNCGQVANIQQVYRGFIFLRNTNCGVFAENAKNLLIVKNPDEHNKTNGNAKCMRASKRKEFAYQRGMQIRITCGSYKGEIGNVIDVRDDFSRVELYSSGVEIRVRNSSIGLIKSSPENATKTRKFEDNIGIYCDENTNDSGCWSATDTPDPHFMSPMLPDEIPAIPKPIFVIRRQGEAAALVNESSPVQLGLLAPTDSSSSHSSDTSALSNATLLLGSMKTSTINESTSVSQAQSELHEEPVTYCTSDESIGSSSSDTGTLVSATESSPMQFNQSELHADGPVTYNEFEESINSSSSNLSDSSSTPSCMQTSLAFKKNPLVRITSDPSDADFNKCGWLKNQDQGNTRAIIYLPFENRTVSVGNTQFEIIEY